MRKYDLLFLVYFIPVIVDLISSTFNVAIDLGSGKLNDTYFFAITLIIQIILGFKYKIGFIRGYIIFLFAFGLFWVAAPIKDDSEGFGPAILAGISWLLAITIYLYSFVLKPIYINIKKQNIVLSKIMITFVNVFTLFFGYKYFLYFLNISEFFPPLIVVFVCFEIYISYILIYDIYNLIFYIYTRIKNNRTIS